MMSANSIPSFQFSYHIIADGQINPEKQEIEPVAEVVGDQHHDHREQIKFEQWIPGTKIADQLSQEIRSNKPGK